MTEAILVAVIVGPVAGVPAAMAAWWSHRANHEIRNGRLTRIEDKLDRHIEQAEERFDALEQGGQL